MERMWKNAAFEGCIHMHALLWGVAENVQEPDEYLREVVEKCASRLTDRQGRAMTSLDTLDLQAVTDADGVADYMTKDLDKPDSTRSRIWLVTRHGLDATTDNF